MFAQFGGPSFRFPAIHLYEKVVTKLTNTWQRPCEKLRHHLWGVNGWLVVYLRQNWPDKKFELFFRNRVFCRFYFWGNLEKKSGNLIFQKNKKKWRKKLEGGRGGLFCFFFLSLFFCGSSGLQFFVIFCKEMSKWLHRNKSAPQRRGGLLSSGERPKIAILTIFDLKKVRIQLSSLFWVDSVQFRFKTRTCR